MVALTLAGSAVLRSELSWSLDLPDRVLLVAVYWRTNLTMRQLGPLFGTSHSAMHGAIDTLEPLRSDEDGVAVDVTRAPEVIVEEAVTRLGLDAGRPPTS